MLKLAAILWIATAALVGVRLFVTPSWNIPVWGEIAVVVVVAVVVFIFSAVSIVLRWRDHQRPIRGNADLEMVVGLVQLNLEAEAITCPITDHLEPLDHEYPARKSADHP